MWKQYYIDNYGGDDNWGVKRMGDVKMAIAVLSGRDLNPMFVAALNGLTAQLQNAGIKGVDRPLFCMMFKSNVGCISAGRQLVLDECISHDFTHVLFIDDDMVFGKDILDSMFQNLDRFAVIGLNAVRKDPTQNYFCARTLGGEMLSSEGKTGCEEVLRIGMGIMLIYLKKIQHIPAPHFEVRWNFQTGAYISEDFFFCDKLRAHCITIGVDHDSSQTVGHVGDYVYGIK